MKRSSDGARQTGGHGFHDLHIIFIFKSFGGPEDTEQTSFGGRFFRKFVISLLFAIKKVYKKGAVSLHIMYHQTASSFKQFRQSKPSNSSYIFNMKFIVPALAIFASLAVAKNCQEGLNYCSFTLMGKGIATKLISHFFLNRAKAK
jgi:actin-related protein